MSRLTRSPLERLLDTLSDDDALVKCSTLKTVMRAMMRQVPIPGRGMQAKELPDGIVLEVVGGDLVWSYPFRVTVVEGVVRCEPGYWEFCGQPTFPGWQGAGASLIEEPDAELIGLPSSGTWRVYLQVEFDEFGIITVDPVLLQSVSALPSADTGVVRILLAVATISGGGFEVVNQVTGGAICSFWCGGVGGPAKGAIHQTF